MTLYLLLDILLLLVPLAISYHPKVKIFRRWKSLLITILVSIVLASIYDILLIRQSLLQYDAAYLLGIEIAGLPLERWLFFLCMPVSSIFLFGLLKSRNKRLRLSKKVTKFITYVMLFGFFFTYYKNPEKGYTTFAMASGIAACGFGFFFNKKLLRSYYLIFPFMYIPFFVIDAMLTGTGLGYPTVTYTAQANLGHFILSVPFENLFITFSVILVHLLLFEWLKKLLRQ